MLMKDAAKFYEQAGDLLLKVPEGEEEAMKNYRFAVKLAKNDGRFAIVDFN